MMEQSQEDTTVHVPDYQQTVMTFDKWLTEQVTDSECEKLSNPNNLTLTRFTLMSRITEAWRNIRATCE
jgi:hypothetical protein